MADRFKDKNILIIGGNSGIGKALARQVHAEGGSVYIAGRSETDLEFPFLQWDALQPDEKAFDTLPDELHGLAYCVGTITLKPFGRLSLDDFTQDWRINVLGAVAALQPNIGRLKQSKMSSVVFFSSVAAGAGLGFHVSIASAKSALEGLSVALAAEFAQSGIRFNAIAPSLTDTPLAANLLSTEEKREAAIKRHPLGRYGRPEDLAHTAAFLLSDEASWITAQVLGVDGGLGNIK